jgi:PAT family beta-lactamase induction signal transducer AmpG
MTPNDRKLPPPYLFAILLYPFGAIGGYLGVAIAYDLTQNGVSVAAVGGLIAVSYIPNTWKFLWAPIIDTTLTPRIWYVGSAVLLAIGTVVMGVIPTNEASLTLLGIIVFLVNLVATFNGMTCDTMAAYCAPMEKKGVYGGWLQVGNLAGSGIGGGAALWASRALPERWMAGALLGATFVLCSLALLAIPKIKPQLHEGSPLARVAGVARDAWAVARSRAGWLAILVLFLPMGTGAASNLWSAVAGDWSASVDSVALANGALSGVAAGIGCLIGGYLCDRMDRKWSYAAFGIVQAGCLVGMAVAPHTATNYVTFAMLYSVTSGLTYASFSGLTLEAIGLGAAATKYNLLASLSNMPIQYMTLVDGHVHDTLGPSAMLYAEAGIGVLAVIVYWAVQRLTGRRRPLASTSAA